MRASSLILLLALAPSPAFAESGVPACSPGTISPQTDHVPANLETFVLTGGVDAFGLEPSIRLVQRVDGADVERELTITEVGDAWHLTPADPLEPGGAYAFIDSSCEGITGTFETTYFVDEPVALPASLGVTTVSELRARRAVWNQPLEYFVTVGLQISPEARAARALYEVNTFRDGEALDRWLALDDYAWGRSVPCSESTPDAIVEVTFEHRARRYGAEPDLFTDPVTTSVRCGEAIRTTADGRPLTDEEIEAEDRRPPPLGRDAGMLPGDGGVSPDVSGMEPVEGCTCHAGGGAPAPWHALLLVAVLVGWRRSRR